MDHENEQELAEFEQRLQMAMQRREAPMGLKARVLAESRARRGQRRFAEGGGWMLQRIAASAVLAAIASGIVVYHQMEVRSVERQKGEEAKAQVMLALRITNRALDRINDRINDKSSSSEENR